MQTEAVKLLKSDLKDSERLKKAVAILIDIPKDKENLKMSVVNEPLIALRATLDSLGASCAPEDVIRCTAEPIKALKGVVSDVKQSGEHSQLVDICQSIIDKVETGKEAIQNELIELLKSDVVNVATLKKAVTTLVSIPQDKSQKPVEMIMKPLAALRAKLEKMNLKSGAVDIVRETIEPVKTLKIVVRDLKKSGEQSQLLEICDLVIHKAEKGKVAMQEQAAELLRGEMEDPSKLKEAVSILVSVPKDEELKISSIDASLVALQNKLIGLTSSSSPQEIVMCTIEPVKAMKKVVSDVRQVGEKSGLLDVCELVIVKVEQCKDAMQKEAEGLLAENTCDAMKLKKAVGIVLDIPKDNEEKISKVNEPLTILKKKLDALSSESRPEDIVRGTSEPIQNLKAVVSILKKESKKSKLLDVCGAIIVKAEQGKELMQKEAAQLISGELRDIAKLKKAVGLLIDIPKDKEDGISTVNAPLIAMQARLDKISSRAKPGEIHKGIEEDIKELEQVVTQLDATGQKSSLAELCHNIVKHVESGREKVKTLADIGKMIKIGVKTIQQLSEVSETLSLLNTSCEPLKEPINSLKSKLAFLHQSSNIEDFVPDLIDSMKTLKKTASSLEKVSVQNDLLQNTIALIEHLEPIFQINKLEQEELKKKAKMEQEKREKEEKARQLKEEEDKKAKLEKERLAKDEQEKKAKQEEKERILKEEAEKQAQLEKERLLKEEQDMKVKLEQEKKEKEEQEVKAKAEKEKKEREEKESKDKLEQEKKEKEEKAKLEKERKEKEESDKKAKLEKEKKEQEKKQKEESDKQAKLEKENKEKEEQEKKEKEEKEKKAKLDKENKEKEELAKKEKEEKEKKAKLEKENKEKQEQAKKEKEEKEKKAKLEKEKKEKEEQEKKEKLELEKKEKLELEKKEKEEQEKKEKLELERKEKEAQEKKEKEEKEKIAKLEKEKKEKEEKEKIAKLEKEKKEKEEKEKIAKLEKEKKEKEEKDKIAKLEKEKKEKEEKEKMAKLEKEKKEKEEKDKKQKEESDKKAKLEKEKKEKEEQEKKEKLELEKKEKLELERKEKGAQEKKEKLELEKKEKLELERKEKEAQEKKEKEEKESIIQLELEKKEKDEKDTKTKIEQEKKKQEEKMEREKKEIEEKDKKEKENKEKEEEAKKARLIVEENAKKEKDKKLKGEEKDTKSKRDEEVKLLESETEKKKKEEQNMSKVDEQKKKEQKDGKVKPDGEKVKVDELKQKEDEMKLEEERRRKSIEDKEKAELEKKAREKQQSLSYVDDMISKGVITIAQLKLVIEIMRLYKHVCPALSEPLDSLSVCLESLYEKSEISDFVLDLMQPMLKLKRATDSAGSSSEESGLLSVSFKLLSHLEPVLHLGDVDRKEKQREEIQRLTKQKEEEEIQAKAARSKDEEIEKERIDAELRKAKAKAEEEKKQEEAKRKQKKAEQKIKESKEIESAKKETKKDESVAQILEQQEKQTIKENEDAGKTKPKAENESKFIEQKVTQDVEAEKKIDEPESRKAEALKRKEIIVEKKTDRESRNAKLKEEAETRAKIIEEAREKERQEKRLRMQQEIEQLEEDEKNRREKDKVDRETRALEDKKKLEKEKEEVEQRERNIKAKLEQVKREKRELEMEEQNKMMQARKQERERQEQEEIARKEKEEARIRTQQEREQEMKKHRLKELERREAELDTMRSRESLRKAHLDDVCKREVAKGISKSLDAVYLSSSEKLHKSPMEYSASVTTMNARDAGVHSSRGISVVELMDYQPPPVRPERTKKYDHRKAVADREFDKQPTVSKWESRLRDLSPETRRRPKELTTYTPPSSNQDLTTHTWDKSKEQSWRHLEYPTPEYDAPSAYHRSRRSVSPMRDFGSTQSVGGTRYQAAPQPVQPYHRSRRSLSPLERSLNQPYSGSTVSLTSVGSRKHIDELTSARIRPPTPTRSYVPTRSGSISKPHQRAYIVNGLVDKTVIHGGKIRLSCNIGGDPNPSIEWMKDGKSIAYHTEASRYKTECNYGVACLEVEGARLSDAGQYTCVVKNVDGQTATTCTVRVALNDDDDKEWESIENELEANMPREVCLSIKGSAFGMPRVTGLVADPVVPCGGTIAVHVQVAGCHRPEVTWLHGGAPLPKYSPRVHYFEDGGLFTLLLEGATPSESGVYTCRVSGRGRGAVDTATTVQVVEKRGHEKPAIFTAKPDTRMTLTAGDDMTLTCYVGGEPRPQVMLTKGIKDITTSCRTLKEIFGEYVRLTLKRVTLEDRGTFFIIAKNIYGTDRTFVTLDVRERARSLTPPSWSERTTSLTSLFKEVHHSNPSWRSAANLHSSYTSLYE
ncbi:hypothetical protein GE061_005282 [Apolygus lucorum]|uniref:Ig-like domain-containing protein n=1 Tax=Apolygus lucorum TaxID=248454 RepID=A0A8S9WZS2_APOLU|nr:hypothetical protein GE061_005282 [Apolygus lucorum]